MTIAATKTKEFIKVIRNPARFILNLKATYKAIKEIKQPEGSTKGKKIATSHTKKYFKVLKKKLSRTYKAFNIPTTSKKPLGKNLIKFSSEIFPLVSPTLSTVPVKKLNLTTFETILKSSLSSLESLTNSSSSRNSSLNIMVVKKKMII